MWSKRHSPEEVATKLRQASKLEAEGKPQAEIANNLGISVMTYHRWRKQYLDEVARLTSKSPSAEAAGIEEQLKRIEQLQLENNRLRRLVTDLLLEKMTLLDTMKPE
jgi:putative transposase